MDKKMSTSHNMFKILLPDIREKLSRT
uniref:Uncharacterized protein n=1 Tax=Rhizophora mucronata TaxID=61149 RepID=A0A2P2PG34_RHIMU